MKKSSRVFFMFVLATVFFTFAVTVMAKGDLVVTVRADQKAFSENESVLVKVTFSNQSNGAVKILKWYTPFDDVEEPLFKITRDGVPVEYIGAH
jgi:peptidyl-Lys metalloendopeptidase